MSIIDLILLSMPLIRYGEPSLWRAVTVVVDLIIIIINEFHGES